jgi:uncharacterized protein
MHILLITLELHIPLAHSLKDKRGQIKSLKDRISHRFNVSIAEIDFLDDWQRAMFGLCIISNDKSYLDKQYSLIETMVIEFSGLEIAKITREWI